MPDISQNMLLNAGLGLLGSGTSGGQVNPFYAAAQGFQSGRQQDIAEEERAYTRQQRVKQAQRDAA